MSSRDDILGLVRANRPQLDRPLPAVPLFDDNPPASLLAGFKESLHRMGGLFLDPPSSGDPLAPVRAKIAGAKAVCSTVPEISGNRDIANIGAPAGSGGRRFRDRPRFLRRRRDRLGAAERSRSARHAVGYLAQHLIVLLDPADIVVNLHHAYRRPELRDNHYARFHTGPSATADIEGVLIHGAQGVRSLSVLPLARAARNPAH
jgi:L-lactate dehydrogenase complex protein LldG